jgi:serine/threonine-protein kinase
MERKDGEEPKTIVVGGKKKELSGNIFGSVTYYLKRKIADGGMGSVYEAEQFGAEGFIKKVAIKTILPDYVQRKQFVSSFVGEAKLVANLVHQNIVQIHQLGRHEDGYYIAMEYIDGINLTDFLARHRRLKKPIPVDIATFIVSRICRGLEYAHNKTDEQGAPLGLVHRDVSPNNIMITREGEVKLTDFGVAKAAQFMEEDEQYLVGSVEYMSPEQANCDPVDGRSDLFSLGLIYYELLTGVRVFLCAGDDDVDKTVERVKAAAIPDPLGYRADLPASVVRNLMRCLKKTPEERFQTARELADALEQDMYSKGYGPTIVALAEYTEGLYGKAGAKAKNT